MATFGEPRSTKLTLAGDDLALVSVLEAGDQAQDRALPAGGPRRTMNSPSATRSDTSSTACTSPNFFDRFRTTSPTPPFYCLSAPAMEACTNQRWKIRKTIVIGIMVITAAAEITPQFVTNWP